MADRLAGEDRSLPVVQAPSLQDNVVRVGSREVHIREVSTADRVVRGIVQPRQEERFSNSTSSYQTSCSRDSRSSCRNSRRCRRCSSRVLLPRLRVRQAEELVAVAVGEPAEAVEASSRSRSNRSHSSSSSSSKGSSCKVQALVVVRQYCVG